MATRKPSYLIILDETPDGKLTQIYPNHFSTRAMPKDQIQASLEPGRTMTVPDPENSYAGFVYVVDKALGDGMISVLETDAPLTSVDLGGAGVKTFAPGEERRSYLVGLLRELASKFLPKAGMNAAPEYSAVYLPYTVKP